MTILKRIYLVLIVLLALTSCKKQSDVNNDATTPTACFSVSPDVLSVGTSVTFNSSCSDQADSYLWDFGDGNSSTQSNPTNVYTEPGNYDVTLTVTASNGNTAKKTLPLTIIQASTTEHSGVIDTDETWGEGIHVITGSVYVSGATLTIMPGAIVKFNEGTSLFIGQGDASSALIADGTSDKRIKFTSSSSAPSAGDWDRIEFGKSATNTSSLKYCDISYGGGFSNTSAMILVASTSVTIENCSISDSYSEGINIEPEGFFESFINNEITDCAGFAIDLFPNAVSSIGTNNYITSAMGIGIKSGYYTQDHSTWLKQTVPYVAIGDIQIRSEAGCQLTLAPGVTIEMGKDASLLVCYGGGYGTLIAEGTPDEPILITSAATTDKSPGSWDRIAFFDGTGSGTSLKNCVIEYGGGYGPTEGMVVIDNCSVSMENCELRYSDNYGIRVGSEGSFTSFTNNYIHDNAYYAMKIFANYVHTIGTGNTINSDYGIEVNSDTYDQPDQTWLKQTCPYVINGVVYIENPTSAKLTIEPGTTIKLMESGAFRVGYHTDKYGVLVADGTSAEKIIFTTSAGNGSQAPGQWKAIFFDNGTGNGSILNNCAFSYGGGYSSQSGMVVCTLTPAGVPAITNCDFTYSESWGIYLGPNTSPDMSQNTFSNNTLGEVKVN
ncbi:MAG: right-handed parallel beta-helix repeat-containing protein [Bacteroidales bacterium]|nr:right-handed parallel beta-helix repeat-containing protein [Bacteroidales bacterium]